MNGSRAEEEVLGEEATQEAMMAISDAFNQAQLFASAGHQLPDQVIDELKSVAARLADEILKAPDVAVWLKDMAEADLFSVRHSLDTCVIGLLIGKRLMHRHGWLDYKSNQRYDLVEEKLSRLGMGLLLHDIGKILLPTTLLHKTDFSPDELELYRRHPIMGAEILKGDHISPLVRAVVRWHHENWDGSGYPHGLEGENINEMARICSVANIYDVITSERPGQPGLPVDVGVERIVMGSGSEFDPRVVDIFRVVVAPYPLGTEVKLSDGRRAIVVALHEEALARPRIRVIETEAGEPLTPIEIDLREIPDLAVVGSI